jgi:hypothetical protein
VNFLHSEVDAGSGEVVQVSLNKQANVKVMDGHNFRRYRSGQSHNYYGGLAEVSPFYVRPPYRARWHVTVDLGGYGGSVRASVSVV